MNNRPEPCVAVVGKTSMVPKTKTSYRLLGGAGRTGLNRLTMAWRAGPNGQATLTGICIFRIMFERRASSAPRVSAWPMNRCRELGSVLTGRRLCSACQQSVASCRKRPPFAYRTLHEHYTRRTLRGNML